MGSGAHPQNCLCRAAAWPRCCGHGGLAGCSCPSPAALRAGADEPGRALAPARVPCGPCQPGFLCPHPGNLGQLRVWVGGDRAQIQHQLGTGQGSGVRGPSAHVCLSGCRLLPLGGVLSLPFVWEDKAACLGRALWPAQGPEASWELEPRSRGSAPGTRITSLSHSGWVQLAVPAGWRLAPSSGRGGLTPRGCSDPCPQRTFGVPGRPRGEPSPGEECTGLAGLSKGEQCAVEGSGRGWGVGGGE